MKFSIEIRFVGLVVILAGLLAACVQTTPIPSAPTPIAPTPLTGQVTVRGRIINAATNNKAVGIVVRLAVAYPEDDLWVDDQVRGPSATTNDDGYFVINNVVAGTYVIVVGFQESAYGIVEVAPDKAKIFTLEADQVLDVGDLVVQIH